jgi:DNA replication and repair protein RecF
VEALSTLHSFALETVVTERLAVTRLVLTDYRCYATLRLETDRRPVVLTGPNGAGKTNLLEALSFLVPGRGLRRARLGDVARRAPGGQAVGWAVAATLETPDGKLEVGTGISAEEGPAGGAPGRRVVRLDGVPARNHAALAERVSVLWLTPDMLRLFSDSAGGRRRFLDRLVFALDPAHAGRLNAYERARRERARLLRDGAPDPGWVAALEATMAERGIAITAARMDLAARLNTAARPADTRFPTARLEVSGAVEDWLGRMSALAAEDRMREALARSRPADAAAGGTPLGPHRSDLLVTDLARGLAAGQCSTGEQKALLVSIVLANARLGALERDAVPILLLDEVAAHLDEARRAALFEEICTLGAQTWMAGTDAAIFAPLGDRATYFRVEDARLTAMPSGTS